MKNWALDDVASEETRQVIEQLQSALERERGLRVLYESQLTQVRFLAFFGDERICATFKSLVAIDSSCTDYHTPMCADECRRAG